MANLMLPSYFISHGGGPWPYMQAEMGNTYAVLAASLREIPRQLPSKPQAVLVISGHWEAAGFRVMANPQPSMVYDYSGFPAHTYQVKYSAPGSPELALRVQSLSKAAGIEVALDSERGFDHGTFVPLHVMYPDADVPVLQLSLHGSYDPAAHFALGQALASLRGEGVLILGSGLSYHNLRQFGPAAREPSKAFDDWLQHTLGELAPRDRRLALLDWSTAPSARQAHPREDHLLPLLVALGAAEEALATCIYHEDDFFGGISVSSFRFG